MNHTSVDHMSILLIRQTASTRSFIPARILLPMPPPKNTFRSGRAQPPKREHLGFSTNLRGARARHTRCQKGGTVALRPRSIPPTITRSFVSRRHKFRGDPIYRTGFQCWLFFVREGAQRLVIKVYICMYGWYGWVGGYVSIVWGGWD